MGYGQGNVECHEFSRGNRFIQIVPNPNKIIKNMPKTVYRGGEGGAGGRSMYLSNLMKLSPEIKGCKYPNYSCTRHNYFI